MRSNTRPSKLAALVAVSAILVAACASGDGYRRDPVVNSIELQPGDSTTAVISTHCGYEWLEVDINGQSWTTTELGTDSAGNPTELAWPQGVQGTELQLRLVDESTLEVTAPGTDVIHTYRPDPEPRGCD
jgi:hypothetical protein